MTVEPFGFAPHGPYKLPAKTFIQVGFIKKKEYDILDLSLKTVLDKELI
jgi:hypothetical protein